MEKLEGNQKWWVTQKNVKRTFLHKLSKKGGFLIFFTRIIPGKIIRAPKNPLAQKFTNNKNQAAAFILFKLCSKIIFNIGCVVV